MININLDKTKKYIISTSGGVDSMALLDLLFKYGYDLVVVHFNHQVRKESKLDYGLVKEYTETNKIPFHYFKLDVPHENFQENARKLRQNHLQDIAKQYKTKFILTAHHLNDLAETIIMNITTGSSLSGYAGFKERTHINSYIYIKPLLSVSKDDLYAYAKKNNVKFLEDKSNKSSVYLRNRVRNKIIPILSQEPNFLNNILHYSKIIHTANTFIRNQTLDFFQNDELNTDKFINLDKAIQEDIILYLLEKNSLNKSINLISLIISALKNTRKPNITIQLSNNFIFVKEYNSFKIIPNLEQSTNNPKIKVIEAVKNKKNIAVLCYNNLKYPLIVRTRKNGDTLSFSFGTKKLKDFLIDKKVPLSVRNTLWIITDNDNNIIWIPNLYINQTLGNKNKIGLLLEG